MGGRSNPVMRNKERKHFVTAWAHLLELSPSVRLKPHLLSACYFCSLGSVLLPPLQNRLWVL